MPTNPPAVRIEYWPIGRLRPYPNNPRKNDAAVDRMVESILEFGFKIPCLVRGDGEIVDGHLRLKAAEKLAIEEIPVILCDDWTPAQVKAFRLMVNRSVTWAAWDESALALELQEIQNMDFDVNLTGFDDDEIARLLDVDLAGEGLTDEDTIPPLPETAVSRTGDLWLLGEHKLLVGDATIFSDVQRLMAGETADMIFTDLPYNVNYEGYTEDHLKIQGDRMSATDFRSFLAKAFRAYRTVVKSRASLYLCHSSSWQREFQNALEAAGFEVRCQIIWAKNTFAWGFGRYKFQHEPIFYAHVEAQKDAWYGDKSQSTLWQEHKPAANRIHPTAKPVELVERALGNSSRAGDFVADFFGGSGSTLIACERRGRKARLMEIDAKYADCVVRRWEEYSGKKATLDPDGRTFEEIAAERRKEFE